ncbi:MAG: transcription-repair coupling factor [Bacilli bacterium]|nr:transcription-repair coupling factor [Bacilli bacterium]
MHNSFTLFKTYPTVQSILHAVRQEGSHTLVVNSTPTTNTLLASSLWEEVKYPIVYVASNIYKATAAYEMLCQIMGYESVHFYATDDVVATELLAASNEFRYERLHTVNAILSHQAKIIVTHVGALVRPLLPPEVILDHIITLQKNSTINPKEFIRKLVESGYRKVGITQAVGEFSVRGEIIDIFPINRDEPIRVDLFDIEIEYIKTYDPITQKTKTPLQEVTIDPMNELIYSDPEAIIARLREAGATDAMEEDFSDFRNYQHLDRLHRLIGYVSPKISSLLDYLDQKIILYEEVKRCEESYQKLVLEVTDYLQNKPNKSSIKCLYYDDFASMFPLHSTQIFLSEFRSSLVGYSLDFMFDLHGYSIIDYANDLQNLSLDLKTITRPIILTGSTKETVALLEEILKDRGLESSPYDGRYSSKKIMIAHVPNGVSFGFTDGFEVIHESSIFKKYRPRKAKYRSAYQEASPLHDVDELKPGDFVVHFDYGIGEYLGIKTVELQDVKNDYIMLRYSNMELYIPVEKINLLERYQGTEGSTPRLSAIGTKEWEQRKARVKEKLESIARDLIKVQALREEAKGTQYGADDEIQKSFEEDFDYVETPDQLKSIEAIKTDMEEGIIVDRLVCGDVGYGKTEVAMRIALKTVLAGEQVAYLAPTTILTRQHYLNFKERFASYGVSVGLLNRMVDPSVQREVTTQLKSGVLDIVIGTHKLLGEEIRFKKLGLLIVDEEQRFGVVHKEKIKQLKHNVNVLTLTATPIPRTLQMALMGVRQLSLIETPPQNRYPVQTYVLEQNDTIIREAIYRELGREGQVFYLHNRISDLDRVLRRLQRLVPEARILIAHGQMDRTALEDAISAFIDREYDVLLCTTIIETGIDIPNTNTLIVDMADRLGLAQMYQIRGRVGRSDRVSYAYFMFEENKVLTESGSKRLNAIKEFTTLGSGYKIALRDLAIRGAGDILGREQSGFIDSIGLDMYMKLLADAMREAQGIKKPESEDKSWDIEVSKHVDEIYVGDDEVKIYIHKAIASIKTKEDKEHLKEELLDRFGKLTPEIAFYMEKKYLDYLMSQCGIEDVKESPHEVRVHFLRERSETMNGAKLFQRANQLSPLFKFEYRGRKIHIILPKRQKDQKWIGTFITLFEDMKEHPEYFYNEGL